METPLVSIIVPCRNEASALPRCLDALCALDYPRDRLEILVVDGQSEDDSAQLVTARAQDHPHIQLLDNPARGTPHALNLGLRACRGEVFIRVDGHAEVAPDYVHACLRALRADPHIGCVGGCLENLATTQTAGCIALAMASRFGVGSAHFRTGSREGPVDTVAFGAYRRPLLEQLGGFDEELWRNQDDELNYRLRRAGHQIVLDRRIRARYHVRASFRQLFRQYFQYGYWKVYVGRKHGALTNLRQLLPGIFVAGLLVGPWLAWAFPWAAWLYAAGLGAWLLAALCCALRATLHPLRALRVMCAFALLHGGYGLGYWAGIVDFLLLRRRSPRASAGKLTR